MTRFASTLAAATMMSLAAGGAFAAAHEMDVKTTTCEQYLAMDADMQAKFAEAAFADISATTGATARTEPMSEEEANAMKAQCESNTTALAIDTIGGVTSK